MMKSFLVILKLVSRATFVFVVITHELVVHVIFRFNMTHVLQCTPLGSELIHKPGSWATFLFAVITHELVVHVIFRFNVTFVIQWTPLAPTWWWRLSLWFLNTYLEWLLFCSNYKWTCSSCHILFWCDICHTVDTLAPNEWYCPPWCDIELRTLNWGCCPLHVMFEPMTPICRCCPLPEITST